MSVEALVASQLRVAAEDLNGAQLLARAGNRNAVTLVATHHDRFD
jgi:hypothetical protein